MSDRNTGRSPRDRTAAPGAARWAQARRLLYLVTEDWYFCSHRLPIARAARDAGFDVTVATRVDRDGGRIAAEGFRLVALPWRRRSRNLRDEISTLRRLWRLYRHEAPDIVHHIALKPALYGAVVCPPRVRSVSTVAGLGYLSTSASVHARVIRPVVRAALKRVCGRPGARVIVQNPDDRDALVRDGVADPARVVMIRGSGVDVRRFHPAPEPEGCVTVVLVGRMLRSKGVGEMVEAARMLRERRCDVRVVLVGEPDDENPESVPRSTLRGWASEGLVEWRGYVDDVPGVLRAAHIVALPSYREGLPMTLLEAAASARPIVASDVPGCREIVHDGDNGLLVPARDAAALAEAIATLVADPERRAAMGRRGREIVAEFSEEVVVAETLALYRAMLETRAGRA